MHRRVLVVARRFPLPLKSGAQLRIYHTLVELADRFDVTLVAMHQNGEGIDHVEEIEELGIDVYSVYHSSSQRSGLIRFLISGQPYTAGKFANEDFEQRTKQLIDSNEFDLIWVHFLTVLSMIPSDLPSPVILDQHNADIQYWETFRSESLPKRIFATLNQRRLKRIQQRYSDHIDAILSVSEEDAEVTRRWARDHDIPVWVVPNGVDVTRFRPDKSSATAEQTVLFVGSLDRRRNQEAVTWFVNNSWKDIHQQNPEAIFQIVGRNPTQSIKELGSISGVQVIGEVLKVIQYYDRAAVVIAPFVLGGGTKLKVIEALAMERPLVTTPKGAAGIDIHDDQHALVRERDGSFAEAVAELLNSPQQRVSLGKKGRELACEKYSWDEIMTNAIDRINHHFFRD